MKPESLEIVDVHGEVYYLDAVTSAADGVVLRLVSYSKPIDLKFDTENAQLIKSFVDDFKVFAEGQGK